MSPEMGGHGVSSGLPHLKDGRVVTVLIGIE